LGGPFRRLVEADVGEDCLTQVNASEARSAQIGGRQISAGHVGVAEVCPSQIWQTSNQRGQRLDLAITQLPSPAGNVVFDRAEHLVNAPSQRNRILPVEEVSRFHHAM
jgi:hypothetical protein